MNKGECGTKPKLLGLAFKDTQCPSSMYFFSLSFYVFLIVPSHLLSWAFQPVAPTCTVLLIFSPNPRIEHSDKILPSSGKHSHLSLGPIWKLLPHPRFFLNEWLLSPYSSLCVKCFAVIDITAL